MKGLRKPLAFVFALALVTASVGLAVETGTVDRETVDPVQDAQAIACGGLCIAGVAGGIGVAAGAIAAAHFTSDSSVDKSELQNLSAQEKKREIHGAASTQRQNELILLDSYSNYLQDTPNIARMEGKNAYIRALENGTGEGESRTKAKGAVEDYYTVKDIQLIRSWNVTVTRAWDLHKKARNESGVAADFVHPDATKNGNTYYEKEEVDIVGTGTTTVNVQNGSVTAKTIKIRVAGYDGDGDGWTNKTREIGPTDGTSTIDNGHSDLHYEATVYGITVDPPTSDYEKVDILKFQEHADAHSEISTQTSNVISNIDQFIDGTYSSYQKGDIKTTDLVDPYLEAREYSPDMDSDAWSVRSMAALGIEPPKNMSNIGYMEVTVGDGSVYEGVLMSDGSPDGGFEINRTYHADNITGAQYVVKEDGTTKTLNGEFTITNVSTPDGEAYNGTTVKYSDIDYRTTDTEEYQQKMAELQDQIAEINSRQQQMLDGGGGGLFDGIGGSFGLGLTDQQAALLAVVLVFLLLVAARVATG